MPHQLGRVLVTTPSFGRFSSQPDQAAADRGLELIRVTDGHPLDADGLVTTIRTARETAGVLDAVIVGLDTVSAAALADMSGVRVVAKHGVGTDNIDVRAATASGITVVNAPGANSDAVADLTMGLVLATTRRILTAHSDLSHGGWNVFSGRELRGATLGLVGFGRIGQAVARRARAFGTRVVAFDPFLPDEVFAAAGVERLDLDVLLGTADIVSLHLPGSEDAPLLDAAALARLPHGAVLINAARGGLVDEGVAASMLHSGALSAAAFDAFSEEPPVHSPLRDAPNVILTPHIGAYTDLANAAMGVAVVEDIARVLSGDDPVNRVTA